MDAVEDSDLSYLVLVEDEEDMQIMAKMSLEKFGNFKVDVCSSGYEAVEQIPVLQPDLILLDFRMPGMDGVETFRALEDNPDSACIPIIFVTSNVKPKEIQTYYEVGAIGVIPKPFDPQSFPEMVRTIWWNMRGASKDRETIEDLKKWYQESLPKRIETLDEHLLKLRGGDATGVEDCVIRQVSHLLRGTGATYGFPEISRSASIAEDCEPSELDEKTRELIAVLKKFAIFT